MEEKESKNMRVPQVKETRSSNKIAPFMTFFAIGVAYIYVSKSYYEGQLDFEMLILGPILSLILYAGYMYFFGRNISSELKGDNCYYMGFLFTLASLAFSMLEFISVNNLGSTENFAKIMNNFGVAIFSTIGGITLRVLFHQGRKEESIHTTQTNQVSKTDQSDTSVSGVDSRLTNILHNVSNELSTSTSELKLLREDNTKFIESLNKIIGELSSNQLNASNVREELKPVIDELTKISGMISAQNTEANNVNNKQQELLEITNSALNAQNELIRTLIANLEKNEPLKFDFKNNFDSVNRNLQNIDKKLSTLKVNIFLFSFSKFLNIFRLFRKNRKNTIID